MGGISGDDPTDQNQALTMHRGSETSLLSRPDAKPTARGDVHLDFSSEGIPDGTRIDSDDIVAMMSDSGHQTIPEMADRELAHALLDAAGCECDSRYLTDRIKWVADRWLLLASNHSDGCQCMQCMAARKLLAEYQSLDTEILNG